MKKLTLLLSLFVPLLLFSQEKKPLSHDDYDKWNRISNISISKDGNISAYYIYPNTKRGDSKIEIFNKKANTKFVGSLGSSPKISFDNKYVFYKKNPGYELTRSEKLKKIKKDKQTKPDLFIYDIASNQLIDSVNRISTIKSPKDYDGFVAALCLKEIKDKEAYKKLDSTQKIKADLTINNNFLVLVDLTLKQKDTFHNVDQFEFAENGKVLYYKKASDKKKKNAGIFKVDLSTKNVITIDTGKVYKNFSINKQGSRISFLSSLDSLKHESPKFHLNLWEENTLKTFVDSSYHELSNNSILSKYKTPKFSDDGNRLYFYVQDKPRTFVKDTTILDEELAEVDVWSWHDKMLQPEQKVRKKTLQEKSYTAYVNLNTSKITELNNANIGSIYLNTDKEDNYVIGANSSPYDLARSWESPWRKDFYLINTETGASKQIINRGVSTPIIDPSNNYVVFYDSDNKNWYSYNIRTGSTSGLTTELDVVFYNEDDDHPMLPYTYGSGGFTNNDKLLLYDKYDIWEFDLTSNDAPKNITQTGRTNKTTYRTMRLEEDRTKISYLNKQLLLSGFNETTKESGVYSLNTKNHKMYTRLGETRKNFRIYSKSENSNNLIYTRQSFVEFPNIWITDKSFKNHTQISDANPHQKDFKWGSVELVKWKAYDGVELEGLLYKPDNFDPTKKYPMISYFYEKRSQGLNNYSVPTPSASIVNMPYLVSNGYIAFVPDIVYKDGHPGESAYNCIVSGVEAMEKLGFIDSTKMGLQGQSWGGYQTAYLVTRTNKFAAAMAGAPVANMTSAYGGIRWGSGLNRAFQYERTQSRIGKTLWDEGGLELYIENSPLFFVDKINTPMLIMHNDNDGAVPWYQGIEYFMAFRRLQKPAWMLTYNKEAHNLRNVKNKQDLSIRMMQFFDHYLQDKKAPVWMTKGVPILDKKKHYGYELDD